MNLKYLKNLRLPIIPKISKRNFIVGILTLAILGSGGFLFTLQKDSTSTTDEVALVFQNEQESIIEEIGKSYLLPDETPTVATVSDTSTLAGQDFFKNAKNGDKLLIYTNAKRAVLYRPSIGKIIEVGPINLTEGESKVAGATDEIVEAEEDIEQILVTLYNGTQRIGLTLVAQDLILSELDDNVIEIGDREDAEDKPYENTIVIDLSGGNTAFVEEISELIGGEVGQVPDGEISPDSDILIILGQDFADNN